MRGSQCAHTKLRHCSSVNNTEKGFLGVYVEQGMDNDIGIQYSLEAETGTSIGAQGYILTVDGSDESMEVFDSSSNSIVASIVTESCQNLQTPLAIKHHNLETAAKIEEKGHTRGVRLLRQSVHKFLPSRLKEESFKAQERICRGLK